MSKDAGTPVKCKRCNAPLRSAASIKAGYSKRCMKLDQAERRAIEAALAGASADQREKVLEAIEDRAITATEVDGLYMIASSRGDQTYLVHQDACACRAGVNGRRCWHRYLVSATNAVFALAA